MLTLDRSILKEMYMTIGAAAVMLAAVFLGSGEFRRVLMFACDLGINSYNSFLLCSLQLPGIIVWALPAAVTLATSVILARKGYDCEFILLAVSGINPLRMLYPIAALSIACAALSFVLNEYVVPQSRSSINKVLLTSVVNSELPQNRDWLTMLRSTDDSRLVNRVFFIGHHDKAFLHDIAVIDIPGQSQFKVVFAKEGLWRRGRWILRDGNTYECLADQTTHCGRFQELSYDAMGSIAGKLLAQGILPSELPASELAKEIALVKRAGLKVSPHVMVQFYRRYSQPMSCLVCPFVALPLLPLRRRRSLTAGFAYTGIVIALNFILQQVLFSLATYDRIDPLLAAWLPQFILFVIGVVGYFVAKMDLSSYVISAPVSDFSKSVET